MNTSSVPGETRTANILAITACPTGIAHTYMAAEELERAAETANLNLRVETHGSIGVEGGFTQAEIDNADAIVIAADTAVDKSRFVGKRVLVTSVDEAIKRPNDLLSRATSAPIYEQKGDATPSSNIGAGKTLYKALMNGVSHMIPFVVTGGLLIAVALSIGGEATPKGMAIPEDSFWFTINQVGALAFALMIPVLSGYIAAGIADRPGLAPGFITGMIAVNGALYNSDSGAGFIGGIITGVLSGYVALALKKVPLNKYVAPIWPIIVIPITTTLVVGLTFIYVLGAPIAHLFESLTNALAGLDGSSAIVLGAILGAMIAFDMGGPFNKTAFLFGGGLIAAGNAGPMGMAAAAIAVPPLAMGLTTLVRRKAFTKPEQDAGIAALFMGFFGITEGAIPFAAARPLQVIPANVVGGAVAGALAGLWGAKDNVMHGGPIVAVLGAVDGPAAYFAAMLIGVAATTGLMVIMLGKPATQVPTQTTPVAGAVAAQATQPAQATPAQEAAPVAAEQTTADTNAAQLRKTQHESEQTDTSMLSPALVALEPDALHSAEDVVRLLVDKAAAQGHISDVDAVVRAALAREAQASTAVGNAVAIPHAKSAGVSKPTLAFARLSDAPVDWNAPDGNPAKLVFLIAVPEDAGKQHLKILSKLARSLMRAEFRDELLAAETKEHVVDIVSAATK